MEESIIVPASDPAHWGFSEQPSDLGVSLLIMKEVN